MLCGAFHDTAKNPARAPSEPSTFGRGKYRVTTALQTHTLVIVPRLLPLNLPGIPILFSTIYAGLPLERHLPRSVISNVAAFRHHFSSDVETQTGDESDISSCAPSKPDFEGVLSPYQMATLPANEEPPITGCFVWGSTCGNLRLDAGQEACAEKAGNTCKNCYLIKVNSRYIEAVPSI